MKNQTYILGAGMTGLAAGIASGLPIYEAAQSPGGICASYYVKPGRHKRYTQIPENSEAYHFEIGGGHWIFGGDPTVLRFIRSLVPVKTYKRRSAVFFSKQSMYVPYPIQNHLNHLPPEVAAKALTEITTTPKGHPQTMADWLKQSFGSTLTNYFFGPFHELYTAGLWPKIAPQDAYKSPVDVSLAVQGALGQAPPVGYNVTFIYPKEGLNTLAQQMAARCDVHFGKRAVQIDVTRKNVLFDDGSNTQYNSLISTLPLNKMMEMTGLHVDESPDPYTSVLVLNIGATRGSQCPDEHWLYNPDSQSGFHRVGFYSNVDVSFLPKSAQADNNKVSIYVERAYQGGQKPSEEEIEAYANAVIEELKNWQFIEDVEVADPTWIDVAYTWAWPDSAWRAKALKRLEERDVFQVGRYGRWIFQGIADSIRDGFMVGGAFKIG